MNDQIITFCCLPGYWQNYLCRRTTLELPFLPYLSLSFLIKRRHQHRLSTVNISMPTYVQF